MKGRVPDGGLVNIKGTATNAGGKIIAQFNQGIKSDIWMYTNSVPEYNTDFYTLQPTTTITLVIGHKPCAQPYQATIWHGFTAGSTQKMMHATSP
jgi:hypothetical protein